MKNASFFSNFSKKIVCRKNLGMLLLGLLASIPTFAHSATTSSPSLFTKTLRLGSVDQEVIFLKQILAISLNSTDTNLVNNENVSYFGKETYKNVLAFQEKYKDEVLTPLGLTKGTGIVGEMTRKKLNQLVEGTLRAPSSSLASLPTSAIRLFKADKVQVAPGALVTLEGKGFTAENNTVFFGQNYTLKGQKSFDLSHIFVTIPSDMPFGEYVVSVENSRGQKTNGNPLIHILVTGNPQLPPNITSITPLSAPLDGKITISGSSFTPSNNTIITGFGKISGLGSNNGTIVVNVKDFQALAALARVPSLKGLSLPMWIYVENANGISKDGFSFTIKNN